MSERLMTLQQYHQARLSKDVRFDGKFFTAVLTTGIFCRPICTARTPKPENVRYYKSAIEAQAAGFRPCKCCFPELAPDTPIPVAIKQLTKALESGLSLQALSLKFALSDRQIRRLFVKHYGIPPIKYLHHQKLLLARKLLRTTSLSITDIAFGSGFSSIRRFNEAIKKAYHCSPSHLRKNKLSQNNLSLSILLPYSPSFDWPLMINFFKNRQLNSTEFIDEKTYCRTININNEKGWISICHVAEKSALKLTVQLDNYHNLDIVIKQVRQMFDLDVDIVTVQQQLKTHPVLAKVVDKAPGLRLPGCWNIFEFSIRAILGQQISVKAATTLANRISIEYGKVADKNPYGLTHHFPTSDDLIDADYLNIGLTKSRISTLKNWVTFYQGNKAVLTHYHSLEALENILIKIKGIGPWTINYIAMRGLSEPDAFPSADLGIIKALTKNNKRPNNKEILALSENWRPWRAYAAIYLWHSLAL